MFVSSTQLADKINDRVFASNAFINVYVSRQNIVVWLVSETHEYTLGTHNLSFCKWNYAKPEKATENSTQFHLTENNFHFSFIISLNREIKRTHSQIESSLSIELSVWVSRGIS